MWIFVISTEPNVFSCFCHFQSGPMFLAKVLSHLQKIKFSIWRSMYFWRDSGQRSVVQTQLFFHNYFYSVPVLHLTVQFSLPLVLLTFPYLFDWCKTYAGGKYRSSFCSNIAWLFFIYFVFMDIKKKKKRFWPPFFFFSLHLCQSCPLNCLNWVGFECCLLQKHTKHSQIYTTSHSLLNSLKKLFEQVKKRNQASQSSTEKC